MACCRQTTSHYLNYLNQRRPSHMVLFGNTRPQWVDYSRFKSNKYASVRFVDAITTSRRDGWWITCMGKLLYWRHMDVTMSQFYAILHRLLNTKENITAPHYWPFVKGFPHEGPVMRKLCLCHDVSLCYFVFINSLWSLLLTWFNFNPSMDK